MIAHVGGMLIQGLNVPNDAAIFLTGQGIDRIRRKLSNLGYTNIEGADDSFENFANSLNESYFSHGAENLSKNAIGSYDIVVRVTGVTGDDDFPASGFDDAHAMCK